MAIYSKSCHILFGNAVRINNKTLTKAKIEKATNPKRLFGICSISDCSDEIADIQLTIGLRLQVGEKFGFSSRRILSIVRIPDAVMPIRLHSNNPIYIREPDFVTVCIMVCLLICVHNEINIGICL